MINKILWVVFISLIVCLLLLGFKAQGQTLTARTDQQTVQLPKTPDLGNLTGMDKVIVDPDFGTEMLRATDSTIRQWVSFSPPGGGSADARPFSADDKLIAFSDSGQRLYVAMFDPDAFQVHSIIFNGAGDGYFDVVKPNLMWNTKSTVLNAVTFTNNTYKVAKVFDYKVGIPATYKPFWTSDGGISRDGTRSADAISSGIQNTAPYVVVRDQVKGWRTYDTQTGQITGTWGTNGAATTPLRFLLHNAKLSVNGDYVVITESPATCTHCTLLPLIWFIDSNEVVSCSNLCDGHWYPGAKMMVNSGGKGSNGNSQFQWRWFTSPTISTAIVPVLPIGLKPPFDTHITWNSNKGDDKELFFVTTTDNGLNKTFPAAWYNELLLVNPVTGTVYREGHTRATYIKTQSFPGKNAIGPDSTSGRFGMFATDWSGSFGSTTGKAFCNTNCRTDVVIVKFK